MFKISAFCRYFTPLLLMTFRVERRCTSQPVVMTLSCYSRHARASDEARMRGSCHAAQGNHHAHAEHTNSLSVVSNSQGNPLWVYRWLLSTVLVISCLSLFASTVWAEVADSHATQSTIEQPRRKVVATTFTVIQDMARNVAGDLWEVVSITPPNAEIHEYEPSPKDILKARRADLLLWNGLGLERWFERFYTHMDDIPVAVLSKGLAPMPLVKGPYKGEPNPHGWISPANAAIYIDNIQQALTEQDPAHAEIYRRNATAYKARIARLNAPIAQRLARISPQQRKLTTCEGAFSYLARDYDVGELYLWAVNSEQEGTPQQIRNVVDTVRKDHIPVVFCESTVSPRAMKQVARETHTHFGGVLYVDSLSSKDGPVPTYERLLAHNAKTILEGFDVNESE